MPVERETRTGPEPGRSDRSFQVPEPLRSRLAPWIDVNEVGPAGLWVWLETILPVLPSPLERGADPKSSTAPGATRVRQLARDLVDCARDRARLTILCDRYYRDNQVLSVRLKSVEAALATTRSTGRAADAGEDPEAAEAAERYLPPR